MLYHGTYVKFEKGHELKAKNDFTSNHFVNDLEKLFESYRPKNCFERKKSVFLSDSIDLIDALGGFTDAIYSVEADSVQKSDLAWYTKAQEFLENGSIEMATKCAIKYWSGEKFYEESKSCMEYRAMSAKIIDLVELNVDYNELEPCKDEQCYNLKGNREWYEIHPNEFLNYKSVNIEKNNNDIPEGAIFMNSAGIVHELKKIDISDIKNFILANDPDPKVIANYKNKIKKNEKINYIELIFNENVGKYFVGDGCNRITTYSRMKKNEVFAWVAYQEKGKYYPLRHVDIIDKALKSGIVVDKNILKKYPNLPFKESKKIKLK